MELQTISKVSRCFGISTRTLRYYEQIGLIYSSKKDDFAYRAYDEFNISRLRQIIVLRKLRIPLKKIAEILKSGDATVATVAFEKNLAEIEDEITALTTIRGIVKTFIERLNLNVAIFSLPDDESLLEVLDALTVSKINFKEEKTMADLNKASETLNRLKDEEVRIVYLPPATVLSHHAMGDDGPHDPLLEAFERELAKIKPDFRHYGYDHNIGDLPGYERLVTIPDDMDVNPPFTKRHFPGGMYAACVLPVYDYEKGWGRLVQWADASEKYEHVKNIQCLEEHSTAAVILTGAEMYIDLLLPIKLRTN